MYDVIIIGGSYAGLSAALVLGRSLRKVLVIDSGMPCNRQTPFSHNFLTRDGEAPQQLRTVALEQVLQYHTVTLHEGFAVSATPVVSGFEIITGNDETFTARKLILATGLKDIIPEIPGFAACWGISIVHCPYCHGYEVRDTRTALICNGDMGFHFAQKITQWTKDLTILTNGAAFFSTGQANKLAMHGINILEKNITAIDHVNGKVRQVVFGDGTTYETGVVYAKPAFVQHSGIPAALGCELTEQGLLKVDMFQRTTIPGVFATGDNAHPARGISIAVAAGTMAGICVNNELIDAAF